MCKIAFTLRATSPGAPLYRAKITRAAPVHNTRDVRLIKPPIINFISRARTHGFVVADVSFFTKYGDTIRGRGEEGMQFSASTVRTQMRRGSRKSCNCETDHELRIGIHSAARSAHDDLLIRPDLLKLICKLYRESRSPIEIPQQRPGWRRYRGRDESCDTHTHTQSCCSWRKFPLFVRLDGKRPNDLLADLICSKLSANCCVAS